MQRAPQRANYSCKKVFPYDPTLSHNTSVKDRRTDGGRQTDDNDAKNAVQHSCIASIKTLEKQLAMIITHSYLGLYL